MKYFEFGKENKERMVLLHGGGTCYPGVLPAVKSWKNQDKCLIGKKMDYSVFQNTDMHIWFGVKGTADRKLSAGPEELQSEGYPFTCKIFEDMEHGELAGENTDRFIEEVKNDCYSADSVLRSVHADGASRGGRQRVKRSLFLSGTCSGESL